jgi:hypothetical protein
MWVPSLMVLSVMPVVSPSTSAALPPPSPLEPSSLL